MTLKSKEDWIDRFPNSLKVLPKQGINDVWLWVDANGDHCKIGADFEAARQKASYPVKIYKLQRVSEAVKELEPIEPKKRRFFYITFHHSTGNSYIEIINELGNFFNKETAVNYVEKKHKVHDVIISGWKEFESESDFYDFINPEKKTA